MPLLFWRVILFEQVICLCHFAHISESLAPIALYYRIAVTTGFNCLVSQGFFCFSSNFSRVSYPRDSNKPDQPIWNSLFLT